MLTDLTQRWRAGRASYRPAGEPIDTRRYDVVFLPRDREAKAFIKAHHYSGTFPAARFRYGLYCGGELVGVAVYGVPMTDKVFRHLPFPTRACTELNRLALLDSVPANGETWMLARCHELLAKEGIEGIVSFSDPVPRTTRAGHTIFKGHCGIIYQGSNALYVGRATPRTLRLLDDATVFSDRAASKIRARDKGWQYAVEQLVGYGATPPEDTFDLGPWLRQELPRITRPLRHPGNFTYLLPTHSGARRHLTRALQGRTLPYPKLDLAALAA